jgi:TatD DNase family protein
MFVDSHLHLSKEDYDDIDTVIKNARHVSVEYLIISCCELEKIDESLEIIKNNKNVFMAIGLHPSEINKYTEKDLKKIENLLKSEKKIIAVGEIGLDYYYGKENKELQKKLFITQLDMATKLNLPVVIHTRDATFDTISILEKYNLNPIECVFIDDSERNVIGARECGLYAVHAKDRNHDIAVAGLEELLQQEA